MERSAAVTGYDLLGNKVEDSGAVSVELVSILELIPQIQKHNLEKLREIQTAVKKQRYLKAISILKLNQAQLQVSIGEEVTFGYTITNSGDAAL
ncbi:MAG: hypothetical protein U5N58_11645 [Actinomycetota bacterium]|nr:hypothetical protein [Actinomycetota bacterium]